MQTSTCRDNTANQNGFTVSAPKNDFVTSEFRFGVTPFTDAPEEIYSYDKLAHLSSKKFRWRSLHILLFAC
jgi:hypothetical protein